MQEELTSTFTSPNMGTAKPKLLISNCNMDKQTARIEKLLRRKWTTQLDAINHANCTRLAARVHDLRNAGVEVNDRWVTSDSGARFKAYKIL